VQSQTTKLGVAFKGSPKYCVSSSRSMTSLAVVPGTLPEKSTMLSRRPAQPNPHGYT
jgi:hypothetical protein